MKKSLLLIIGMMTFALAACVPRTGFTPAPAGSTPIPAATLTALPVLLTPTESAPVDKPYQNDAFGLGFRFPAAWYGPEEYISDQILRVEVGSDVVYSYGTDRTEQFSTVKNSYNVVIQYSKSDQNNYWKETLQSLSNLQDGESISGARGMTIKVRNLELGRFKGYEFISTLSMTAQTEPVYSRQVMLVDEQSNLLTVSGNPNNVEVSAGEGWRPVYQSIDEANLAVFHEIVASITLD